MVGPPLLASQTFEFYWLYDTAGRQVHSVPKRRPTPFFLWLRSNIPVLAEAKSSRLVTVPCY
jgi:hypothetical protein